MTALFCNSAALAMGTAVKIRKQSPDVRGAEYDDSAVVERSRNGDKAAYRLLVERYQARAHAIAYGILGSYEDAEDVVQEAFVKAYRNLDSFRGHSSFYTWLYRIVFNLAVDLSRKRYRRSELSMGDSFVLDSTEGNPDVASDTLVSRIDEPDRELDKNEFRVRFRQALEDLSAEHRAVIVLREIEGLSYAEISRVVGCSKGTVMSRIHHARKRLRRALSEFSPTDGTDIEDDPVDKVAGKIS